MTLNLLYRGHLTDCNYQCSYCPFAKTRNSRAERARDRQALQHFVDWVAGQPAMARFAILFTPYGEALVRPWYQTALVRLSHLPQVQLVAAQTNLHWPAGWLADCRPDRTALWATYHPDFTTPERFLARCHRLADHGIAYSVGVVGKREHFAAIAALRRRLPAEVYLWVNAYKDEPNYYQPNDITWLSAVDPHFPINLTDHASQGADCHSGENTLSVDGDGNVYRCHFIRERRGNLFSDPLAQLLGASPCSRAVCDCFIGYAHLKRLQLHETFGAGLMARIWTGWQQAAGPLPPPPKTSMPVRLVAARVGK